MIITSQNGLTRVVNPSTIKAIPNKNNTYSVYATSSNGNDSYVGAYNDINRIQRILDEVSFHIEHQGLDVYVMPDESI